MKYLVLCLIVLSSTVLGKEAAKEKTFSIELSGVSNIALHEVYKPTIDDWNVPKVNMYGGDITLKMRVQENHEVYFRAGMMKGRGTATDLYYYANGMLLPVCIQWDLEQKLFAPGYRYNIPVTENTSLFLGGSVGIAVFEGNAKLVLNRGVYKEEVKLKETGIFYSLEAGVKHRFNDNVSIVIAGTLTKIEAEPHDEDGDGIDKQSYAGLRAGIDIRF